MVLKAVDELAKAMKSRPEAALAGITIIAPPLFIASGINVWVATLMPLGVYAIYCARAVFIALMAQKMAQLRLDQTQADGERRWIAIVEKIQRDQTARVPSTTGNARQK
ncbi:MAG TPA: hypothetical protein VG757_08155 [Devosia sp.]|nr:hypothetical protein [Devosia sp.]